MASCGLVALEKLEFLVSPQKIEEMEFAAIETAIQRYLKPKLKLTIAERTKFYSMKQLPSESIIDYLVRLRQGIQYCDFDKLRESPSPAEEMLLVALPSEKFHVEST